MELFGGTTRSEGADDSFVRVVVERGIVGGVGEKGLTYRGEGLSVGQWVRVPLGRKEVGGVVIACGGSELADGFDLARIKKVSQAGEVALPACLISLGQWLSRYYACPLGIVVKAMLPGAVKKGSGVRTRVVVERAEGATGEGVKLSPGASKAWEAIAGLDAALFPMEPRALARLAGASTVGPINRLVDAGLLVRCELREVRAMEQSWMVREDGSEDVPSPTAAQMEIIEGVAGTLGTGGVHLVRGVTGSGKTEVYLRVIERALARDMSSIVLVPEIALTPQTVRRFAGRFGVERVAVFHSKLTGTQRNHAWQACASGRARVLIGPRSAVLAPMVGLGLIVVDEEHDSSYKQDSSPRYHGRDVAVKRGAMEGAVVLLGSATPSLESWRNAKRGWYRLWTLNDRVSGGELPPVRIVDLAAERRAMGRAKGDRADSDGNRQTLDLIGPTLEGAVRRALDAGSQVILLLNRRGEAGYVGCSSSRCGWTMRCGSCDVLLSSHRTPVGRGRYLRCHHCMAAQQVPARCPACGGRMVLLNAGTQHVEEELSRRLGLCVGKDLVRVDSDAMGGERSYFEVLDRFGQGKIKVLLGTQMIAKGLDYPNVGLVGVVNADTALTLPDFRAGERTFQLVSQVAGRAGRGEIEVYGRGLVLVQTMYPKDPAIVLAARHAYEEFAELELAARNAARLPPARRMARVVIRDGSFEHAMELGKGIARRLSEFGGRFLEVEGPEPCTIGRIADRYRVEVRALADRASDLVSVLEGLREFDSVSSDSTYAIDVDPVSVL